MAKPAKKQKGYSLDRGVYSIRWTEGRERLGISLSGKKFSEATIEELCRYIKKLVYYKENPLEVLDKKTKSWLESTNPIILAKLAEVKLIIAPKLHALGELWSEFDKAKKDIKDSTRECYENVKRRFFDYFDPKTDLNELTKEHFEDWKIYLQTDYESPVNGQPLVEATV